MEREPLHILLADDDEGDRLLFTEALSELQSESIVHTVNNGIALMEWLSMDDIHLPDLIFLDLNMPRKDGLSCLKEIKSDEDLKIIFVAIYSTSDTDKDRREAFEHGANAYIAKPNNFDDLKQVLEKTILKAHP